MKAFLLRLALATTIMVPVSSAMAADLDPPPPIDDLRPATYDFSIGIFGAANAIDGRYDVCGGCDPDMSGIGYGFGVKAGWDYYSDNFVIGVVGDWMFGGRLADNDDPVEATYLDMNYLATARLRAGFNLDHTLIYLTGGYAAAQMEFGGLVGPASIHDSDTKWTHGWTIGGGIEHAVTDALTVSLEYLYVDLDTTSHTLSDGMGAGGTLDMMYDDIHTIRAGINYRFSL
ncbi:MAG: porin family protein [Alphaproteobacteria bacterium]|nr:porin family protein [Alphaproteobacteria bacterium]